MRQIRFDTFGSTIAAVEDWSINVTITSEADGTFMFFGHGKKVATLDHSQQKIQLTPPTDQSDDVIQQYALAQPHSSHQ
tara:strand:+ start:358 stop:594 length:237 start_codon:yes stop_codon:yes gene_type:complete